MEINGREYAEFHRRLRYSNLLSLAEDSSVDVFVHDNTTVIRHVEGRILEHNVNDEQASLLVDATGFVMMLDVGNITKITYAPDEDHFTLRVQDRVASRFQPTITPTEVAEYLAETLLDEAADESGEMPEWLADMNLCDDDEDDDDIDGDDLGAHHYEDDEEGGEDTE